LLQWALIGNSMEKLKQGFKQTDIGVIPEEWEVKSVNEIFKFLSTATFSRAELSDEGEIQCLHYGDIHTKFNEFVDFNSVTLSKVTGKRSLNYALLQDGDIIMADASEDYVGLCKSVEVKNISNKKVISGLHTILLREKNETYENGFKGYLFGVPEVKKQLNGLATGMKVYGVSKKNLTQVLVPVPTPTEQKAIATTLNDVDALITALNKKITKKQQIKQGAMQQLLTGKKRLPGYGGECKYKQTEIGLIPEDWGVIKVEEAFRFLSTASFSRDQLGSEGNVQCLHYGDIHTKYNEFIDFKFVELPKVIGKRGQSYPLLQDGDIIMADASEDYTGLCKSVEIKNVGNKKAISGLHTILLRERNNVFENGFKGYIFKIKEVRKQLIELSTGMKVFGVSKKNLEQVFIPVPSKPEQTAIAQILTDMDDEIEKLQAEREKYKQIKAGMMQQLLTGKIRLVNKQTISNPEQKIKVLNVDFSKTEAKKQGHNEQINEAVVISFLVNKFGSTEYPLSRFRYTKYAYLLHRHCENITSGFKKHAAGPYKSDNRYKGPENIAVKNKYITKVKNSNSGADAFVISSKIQEALKYFVEWYGSENQLWIEQFRYEKNNDLEVLTTVDESICDLEKMEETINVSRIKEYIASIPQWKAKLQKGCFSDINIQEAINKSKELFPK
jgi:type I restriction enzyme, S subunit